MMKVKYLSLILVELKDENFNKENRLTVNEKTTNLTTKDGDYEENYNHNINHNCIQRSKIYIKSKPNIILRLRREA